MEEPEEKILEGQYNEEIRECNVLITTRII